MDFNISQNFSSSYKDKFDSLRLIRSKNVGPKTFYKLIEYFGSASEALDNFNELSSFGGNSKNYPASKSDIEKEIMMLEKFNAGFIYYKDKEYPALLKQIHDPPPVLSFKGKIEYLSKEIIGIVGARNCSLNAKNFIAKISNSLKNIGYYTVSGLARGIDTAVHESSFPNTISVIAGGIDHIYPPENEKLYRKICEESLMISELPIGSSPLAKHFPQRNRIISGISKAVIIAEAAIKSGSLITAKFALEQNRDIFVVPGFPSDPRYKGSNMLIKQGAYLLESIEDIIDSMKNSDTKLELYEEKKYVTRMPLYKIIDRSLLNDNSRKRVIETLSSAPVKIDEIIKETGLPYQIITAIILELELAGKIFRDYGNKITLNYN